MINIYYMVFIKKINISIIDYGQHKKLLNAKVYFWLSTKFMILFHHENFWMSKIDKNDILCINKVFFCVNFFHMTTSENQSSFFNKQKSFTIFIMAGKQILHIYKRIKLMIHHTKFC